MRGHRPRYYGVAFVGYLPDFRAGVGVVRAHHIAAGEDDLLGIARADYQRSAEGKFLLRIGATVYLPCWSAALGIEGYNEGFP